MQFVILFIGASVFVFYQFAAPPMFFNPVEVAKVAVVAAGAPIRGARGALPRGEWSPGRRAPGNWPPRCAAATGPQPGRDGGATGRPAPPPRRCGPTRSPSCGRPTPGADASDTNYVFLSFVVRHLPAGLIGLVLAAVFAASMSASSAELNALASTTVVDVYRRLLKPGAAERHDVLVSRLATVGWGAFAVAVRRVRRAGSAR